MELIDPLSSSRYLTKPPEISLSFPPLTFLPSLLQQPVIVFYQSLFPDLEFEIPRFKTLTSARSKLEYNDIDAVINEP